MTENADIVIRGGTIVDGTGADAFKSDIAITEGLITAIAPRLPGKGREEIDAKGLLVIPGFVDIHTHYDGQLTWSHFGNPSSNNGATTSLIGNCGVGFAPCRPGDRETLIRLMEGVEDIPGIVMESGIPWAWETFPDFLKFLESRSFDMDVATQLPHSALRIYTMGQRGADREVATTEDLAKMRGLAQEAMEAGALGFSSSRTLFHRSIDGKLVPTATVAEEEYRAIAAGMKDAGHGMIECAMDFTDVEADFAMWRRIAKESGFTFAYLLTQLYNKPEQWRRLLDLTREANAAGISIKGQMAPRAPGLMMGFELAFHPFIECPSYKAIAHLPIAERIAELRKPEIATPIITEEPRQSERPIAQLVRNFELIWDLGDPPNYEPGVEDSIAARARRLGVSPAALAYDALLARDGKGLLYLPTVNYVDRSLDVALEMYRHPDTVVGIADGGAHYQSICDGAMPTWILQYWTRDRTRGEKLPLPWVVHSLTKKCADTIGLRDRGVLARGYRADLNIINYDKLRVHAPEVAYDLPMGTLRLNQWADGYVATLVGGVATYRDGKPTGQLPGRLIRGPRQAPGRD